LSPPTKPPKPKQPTKKKGGGKEENRKRRLWIRKRGTPVCARSAMYPPNQKTPKAKKSRDAKIRAKEGESQGCGRYAPAQVKFAENRQLGGFGNSSLQPENRGRRMGGSRTKYRRTASQQLCLRSINEPLRQNDDGDVFGRAKRKCERRVGRGRRHTAERKGRGKKDPAIRGADNDRR